MPKDMSQHEDLERKALKFIMAYKEDGILQSDLWRELKATSREGSRISIKLEKKGLIRREKELANGRWTYRLYLDRILPTINSIYDSPCIRCEEFRRCGSGNSSSPNSCNKFLGWIIK